MAKQTVEQLARALKPYVLAWITGATGASAGASTQLHVVATNTSLGPLHSISGVTPDSFLVATATGNDALMRLIAVGDLPVHTSTHSHVDLIGVTTDQHHAQTHVLATTAGLGADHTVSGLTAGQVLRATGTTTAEFAALLAGDLPTHTHDHNVDLTNVTADQHHAQSHVLATTSGLGADHSVSALTAGMVLQATSPTAARFQSMFDAGIPVEVDATVLSAPGVSTTVSARRDHIHGVISASNPGGARILLATNTSGGIQLRRFGLNTGPSASTDGTLLVADGSVIGRAEASGARFVWTDAATDVISVMGARLAVGRLTAARLVDIYTDDALTTPMFRLEQDGVGDTTLELSRLGLQNWSVGIDADEGNRLAIQPVSGLASDNSGLQITTAGDVRIGKSSSSTTPQLHLENTGSGDGALRMTAGTQNFAFGVDHSRVSPADPVILSAGVDLATSPLHRFDTDGGVSIGSMTAAGPNRLRVLDYVYALGGFTTDGTDPGTNRLRVGDYAAILGGLHVGGTADPGTDNADIDGALKVGTGGANPVAGQVAFVDRIIESIPTHVRAYNTVTQAFTNNTWSEHSFNNEHYDTDSMHDNATNPSRLTVSTDGGYIFNAAVRWEANATGQRGIALWRSQLTGDNRWIAIEIIDAVSSGETYQTISAELELESGDYVEVRYFQDSGGNLDSEVLGTSVPSFSAARIA